VQVVNGKTHPVRVGYAREYLIWGLERTLYWLDVADIRVKRRTSSLTVSSISLRP